MVDNEEDRDLVREVVNDFKTNVVDNYYKLQKGTLVIYVRKYVHY